MRYLVDSDWIIDGLNGIPEVVAALDALGDEEPAVSIVTLGEVFEGAFGAVDPVAQLAVFRRYLRSFAIVPLSDPIMETFARIRADPRDQGRLIPDIDLLIAATALTLELEVLTRNVRHFSRIPDIRFYQPR